MITNPPYIKRCSASSIQLCSNSAGTGIQLCGYKVLATYCVHFRWADLTVTAGPYGEDSNDLYGPLVVPVPTGAATVSITAEGSWGHADNMPPEDWYGPDGGSATVTIASTYIDTVYNSQNIPSVYGAVGSLIGFWGDGTYATGAIGGAINIIGSSWLGQSIPTNAEEIVMGFHDGYEWNNNVGYVKIKVTWG